jgi:Raf kinase inhibitor-like YbhB/YbcL family protein
MKSPCGSVVICTACAIAAVLTTYIIYTAYLSYNNLPHLIPMPTSSTTSSTTLKLSSTAFAPGGAIPALYTCDGKDVNPPLAISGVPKGTESLILTVEDPDAPSGTWNHWVVFDIDPSVTLIGEDTQPAGVAGKGSADNLSYQGPCPPSGSHRYIFTLYALNRKLSLPEGASKDQVLNAINGYVLGRAELVGTYARK